MFTTRANFKTTLQKFQIHAQKTVQIFFALKMRLRKPLRRPTTVNVPPMSAQMEVTNSYQCLPFLLITTAMGEMS